MPLLQLILVALIQGITEFLPVSSSGHLILLPVLTDFEDQGQMIDVAVHVGTLGAVVLYFWRDLRPGLAGIPRMLTGRVDTPGARLAFLLMIATIPAVIAGFVLEVTGLNDKMRLAAVIGWTMLLFGLYLYWIDQRATQTKSAPEWTWREALKMGMWQAVALIPGTSRSGITITSALQLGYKRRDAAKLSMLMSVPVIFASGVLKSISLAMNGDPGALRDGVIAAGFSFVAALAALTLMMRLLRSVSFTPYVIYRVILGIGLLIFAYGS